LKYAYLIFCFLVFEISCAQVQHLDSLLDRREYDAFQSAFSQFKTLDSDSSTYWYYRGKFHVQRRELHEAFYALRKVDTLQLSKGYLGWYFYVLGDSYRYNNQEEKAFPLKLRAQQLFREDGNVVMANQVNYDTYYTLVSQDFLGYDGELYLKAFFKNAKKENLSSQLLTAHLNLAHSNPSDIKKSLFHLQEATKYAKQVGTPLAFYKLYNFKAVFYQNYTTDYKKAEIQGDSMLYYAKQLQSPDRIESSLKNIAYLYTLQGRYEDAIQELLKADALPITENVFNRKRHLYEYLSLNYENLGKIDSAFAYTKKMTAYKDSVNIASQNKILTLLETVTLEQKNLELDVERKRNKIYAYIGFIGLFLALVMGIITSRYYRKKKLLAEKEKEMETIDARNEEKDKQRQRIAEELHDNLGSLIVAIQQCFENLKVGKDRFLQEEETLMSKARGLLDEAYQKIRNMAHLEDSASNSSGYWVDRVCEFADNVSESSNFTIDVQSHGDASFENADIENDLRTMVNELITNVIKHANATEVSIDITRGDDFLSILVEDNGVGFDTAILNDNKGIGLYRIRKKIENMQGKLTIDSNLNRGTTLIIDIPL
jgi:signal transduction histidine kinase